MQYLKEVEDAGTEWLEVASLLGRYFYIIKAFDQAGEYLRKSNKQTDWYIIKCIEKQQNKIQARRTEPTQKGDIEMELNGNGNGTTHMNGKISKSNLALWKTPESDLKTNTTDLNYVFRQIRQKILSLDYEQMLEAKALSLDAVDTVGAIEDTLK